MKHLVGYGKGKLPTYEPAMGKLKLYEPFDKVTADDLYLVMNINENHVFHVKNNQELSFSDENISYENGYAEILIDNIGSDTDMIHVWVDLPDGLAAYNPASEAYLQSLNLAITKDLKFDNSNGTLTLDFSGSGNAIETAILDMKASINAMNASIQELASIPDTQLLQVAGSYAITDVAWSTLYSEIVSIRALETSNFILKNDGAIVVDDGNAGNYTLDKGEYLDIKFDEIILAASSKVIVTFINV